MATSLETALRERLQAHLTDLIALRDRNFDRTRNLPRVNFIVKDYLDPATRQCPTRYVVQIRGVAIADVKVAGKSLRTDYQNDLNRMVKTHTPRPLDWQPVVADPYSNAAEPALSFQVHLPKDALRPLAPDVYFDTRVWHPNIRWEDGHTCYGSKQEWGDPTKSLADLVRRVYTMVAYLGHGAVNVQAADLLNKPAAEWYGQMKVLVPEMFPLSPRTLV